MGVKNKKKMHSVNNKKKPTVMKNRNTYKYTHKIVQNNKKMSNEVSVKVLLT